MFGGGEGGISTAICCKETAKCSFCWGGGGGWGCVLRADNVWWGGGVWVKATQGEGGALTFLHLWKFFFGGAPVGVVDCDNRVGGVISLWAVVAARVSCACKVCVCVCVCPADEVTPSDLAGNPKGDNTIRGACVCVCVWLDGGVAILLGAQNEAPGLKKQASSGHREGVKVCVCVCVCVCFGGGLSGREEASQWEEEDQLR